MTAPASVIEASLESLFEEHLRIQRARTDAALEACGFEQAGTRDGNLLHVRRKIV